jgi:putative endonuclease
MGYERKQLGNYGEHRARRAYEQAGYQVLAQNWRGRAGELDLVVQRGDEVVICEVKTRSSDRFGLPAEAVDWRKQRRLRALAGELLATGTIPYHRTIRFDVASILGGRVSIIEGAF